MFHRMIPLSFLLLLVFSLGAAAKTYVVPHDDDTAVLNQLRTQRTALSAASSQGGGYDNALSDDLYFYAVMSQNQHSRLNKQLKKSFENRDSFFVRRELCQDWDWMYDSFYLRVDDTHEFFRFVKSCEDDPAFYDWWYDYWEDGYFWNGPDVPPWWMPHDGLRACGKAKNYQEYLDCRNTFLPHYRADWPSGSFNHTSRVDYGQAAYKSWADHCAEEMETGYVSDWCWKRRWWIQGTVN